MSGTTFRLPDDILKKFSCGKILIDILLVDDTDYNLIRKVNNEINELFCKLKPLEKVDVGRGYFIKLVLKESLIKIDRDKRYPKPVETHLKSVLHAICNDKIRQFNEQSGLAPTKWYNSSFTCNVVPKIKS